MKLVKTLEDLKKKKFNRRRGWIKLLEGINQDIKKPDLNTEVSIRFILESTGLDYAIICLACFPELKKPKNDYIKWRKKRLSNILSNENILEYLAKHGINNDARFSLLEYYVARASLEAWENGNNDVALSISAVSDALDNEKHAQKSELFRMIDCIENNQEYIIESRKK